jgi:alkylation response protein AidB-like acyl-CoA dehydrogenase
MPAGEINGQHQWSSTGKTGMTAEHTFAFSFTEAQQQFRDYLRRFLEDHSPPRRVRAVMATDTGYDRALWQRLADELSLPALCISEQHGGAGFGAIELGIAMEELGRALLPAPFLASAVLGARTVALLGNDTQRAELLPGIAQGTTIATLAWMESPAHDGPVRCRAENGRLSGRKAYVLDGMSADLLLIVAQDSQGQGVYAVRADTPGLERRSQQTIDQTRRLAEIQLSNVAGERLGTVDAVDHALQSVMTFAYTALASESAGGATRLFEDTLSYLQLRHQFGRSIASFQAIKHRMADLLLEVELAQSAARYAAESLALGARDAAFNAHLAKAGTSDAYALAARESVQLHGGIGFTWEHDTQLWFKRAKGSEVLLGDSSWHRARMISELTEGAAA